MPLTKTFRSIRQLRAIYIIITIFLVILSFFVFKQVKHLIESSKWVNHSTQVSLELERTYRSVLEAQSGHRGFLLTHDSSFLQTFHKGLAEYPQFIAGLRVLTSDNLQQQENIDELERICREREADMYNLLEVDNLGTPSHAELLKGKSIMDSLRAQIADMAEVEDKLLTQRTLLFKNQSFFTPLLLLTVTLGALSILLYSYNKLNTELVHSLRMQRDQRLLVHEAPAFICSLHGPRHVFELANEECMRMVGKREILGKPIREALPELEGQGFYELMDDVYRTGNAFIGRELPVRVNDGQGWMLDAFINFECRPSLNSRGEIVDILVYGQDVTELIRARKRAEEKEEQLRIALDGGELGTFDFDPITNKLEWSAKAKEFFGLSADAVVTYDTYLSAIHPEDRARATVFFKSFIDAQNLSMYELEYRTIGIDDRKLRWIRSKGKATIDETGNPARIAGVLQDITQRKEIEIALKAATSKLEQTFNMMPEAVFLFDVKGTLQYVNERGAKVFGNYTPRELLDHKEMSSLIQKANDLFDRYDESGEILHGQNAAVLAASRTGQAASTTIKHINKETKEVTWLLIHATPFTNEQGDVIQLLATSIDITPQKTAENIIKESEARYHNLIYTSPSAIGVLKGKDLVITTANDAIIEIWGKGREILGKKYFEALPELAEQGYREVFDEVYKTGKPFNAIETPVRILQNGKMEMKYYNFILYAQRNAEGIIEGIGIIATEVTSQALYNKKIQESESRFRIMSESLPQLVWVTNAEGINEYTSQRWEEYTGVKPGGLEEWEAIVHPEDIQGVNAAWMHSLSTGENYKYNVRLKSKSGEYRWHTVNGEPVRDEENKIIKWVGAFTDTHNEKSFSNKLEQQVAERTKELAVKNIDLERMNKELESFTYISSHDLQEPLRKIQTFSTRILEFEKDNLSETGKDYFARMQAAAGRMQRLIEDLLAFSRASTNKQNFEPANLNSLVKEVEIELKDTIAEKQATIDAGKLCELYIIPFQFRQLMHNLIGNALKFTKSGTAPKITINSRKMLLSEAMEKNHSLAKQPGALGHSAQEYCHIQVKDNGIGFEPHYSERIFEVFQRLHGKNEYVGTGIGLAIVKKIVENHGGFITACGEVDKGATFDVYIPSDLPK